jgi:hypothetical protein
MPPPNNLAAATWSLNIPPFGETGIQPDTWQMKSPTQLFAQCVQNENSICVSALAEPDSRSSS